MLGISTSQIATSHVKASSLVATKLCLYMSAIDPPSCVLPGGAVSRLTRWVLRAVFAHPSVGGPSRRPHAPLSQAAICQCGSLSRSEFRCKTPSHRRLPSKATRSVYSMAACIRRTVRNCFERFGPPCIAQAGDYAYPPLPVTICKPSQAPRPSPPCGCHSDIPRWHSC